MPPPAPPAPAPATGSLPFVVTLNPTSAYGGQTVAGTVTLAQAAPAGGALVTLVSHDPFRAVPAPSVTVPAGARSANFSVTAQAGLESSGAVAIAGIYNGNTQGARLMTFPDMPVQTLASLTLNSRVTGGGTLVGTVAQYPGWVAPPGGFTVKLASTNPTLANVPPSVTIPAGANSASFPVTTASVTADKSVTILAASHGNPKSVAVTIAAPSTAPTVSALALNPSNVVGGNNVQGTVTLSGAAPAGGAVVTLTNNSGVITGPASVTVPAGASSASFTITTTAVRSATPATITATAKSTSATAMLTISPPAATAGTVAIQRAEYASGRLRIDATSTNASATLTAYNTSTNAALGTLTNNGGGRFGGDLNVSTNPQSITIRSSIGGSATRAVTAK